MKIIAAIPALLALSACVDDPGKKDGERAAAQILAEDEAAALKAEQKSIEEAADAAAKLVEEEAREEIEQLKAE